MRLSLALLLLLAMSSTAGADPTTKLTFEGTVVGCETRFKTKVQRAFNTGEFHADWVLTIRVERADERAPAAAGVTASFLIHSPTHTLFESAEDAIGKRFAFTLVRTDTPQGVRWTELHGSSVD